MSQRTSWTGLAGAFAVVAMAAACSQPASDVPVTTTTEAGQSAAPAADAAAERDTALVRMVNAVPSEPAVDVMADDQRVFEAVNFREVTPYREVDGQRYGFTLRGAGAATDAEPLARNSEGLSDGAYYTVFALPDEDGKPTLEVVKDAHQPPAPGKARVRVVHAAADAGDLDVVVPGSETALITGVDFRSVTDYDEVDPMEGELNLRTRGGTAESVADIANVRLAAGKSYTIVVVGARGPEGGVEALVFQDELTTADSQ